MISLARASAGPVLCLVRQPGPLVLGGVEAHMLDPPPLGGEHREEALRDCNWAAQLLASEDRSRSYHGCGGRDR